MNVLIYSLGEEAEDILVSLQLTVEVVGAYAKVKDKLNAHYLAHRNVIFKRAKFNQREQEVGESIDFFAEHCTMKWIDLLWV